MDRIIDFGDLDIGDEFECYGDVYLNYNYVIICKCTKVEDGVGQEIDGIRFLIGDNEEVWIRTFDTIKKCEACGMSDGIHKGDCSFMVGLL